MSRFPNKTDDNLDPEEKPPIMGTVMGGAFECQSCTEVATTAVWNRQEERLYWVCRNEHHNSIPFKN
jgi:hypothetical protein